MVLIMNNASFAQVGVWPRELRRRFLAVFVALGLFLELAARNPIAPLRKFLPANLSPLPGITSSGKLAMIGEGGTQDSARSSSKSCRSAM